MENKEDNKNVYLLTVVEEAFELRVSAQFLPRVGDRVFYGGPMNEEGDNDNDNYQREFEVTKVAHWVGHIGDEEGTQVATMVEPVRVYAKVVDERSMGPDT